MLNIGVSLLNLHRCLQIDTHCLFLSLCHLSERWGGLRAQIQTASCPIKCTIVVVVVYPLYPAAFCFFCREASERPCLMPLHNMPHQADYTSAHSQTPSISDRQDTQSMLWAATYTFRSHMSSIPWLSYLQGFVFPNLSHPPSLFFSPPVYPSINHLSLSLCPSAQLPRVLFPATALRRGAKAHCSTAVNLFCLVLCAWKGPSVYRGSQKGGGYGGNELALKKTLRAVGLNGMGQRGFF